MRVRQDGRGHAWSPLAWLDLAWLGRMAGWQDWLVTREKRSEEACNRVEM